MEIKLEHPSSRGIAYVIYPTPRLRGCGRPGTSSQSNDSTSCRSLRLSRPILGRPCVSRLRKPSHPCAASEARFPFPPSSLTTISKSPLGPGQSSQALTLRSAAVAPHCQNPVMSSNLPLAAAASKTSNASGQQSPNQAQPSSTAAGDGYGQRRSGGSGSFGAGASTRGTAPPRNNQSSRKQNKNSKKFRSADEDAIAESVCISATPPCRLL